MKLASVVPVARILVIDESRSDVFLLERALNKQDLRFELVHLPNGGEALHFHPQAGGLCGCGNSKRDPGGLEPVQSIPARTSCARSETPDTSSAFQCGCGIPLCLGETRLCSRISKFPNSSSSLPAWINSRRSAKSSRICSQVLEPADGGWVPAPDYRVAAQGFQDGQRLLHYQKALDPVFLLLVGYLAAIVTTSPIRALIS